jgi:hypothetical protein
MGSAAVTADGQLQCIRGQGSVKFAAQQEQFGSAQVMSRVFSFAGGRLNGRQQDRSGFGIDGTIDKQDGFGVGNVFGEFGSPLVVGDDAHAGL